MRGSRRRPRYPDPMASQQRPADPGDNPYRFLPKVDQVLLDPAWSQAQERFGSEPFAGWVRETLDAWRARIADGTWDAAAVRAALENDGFTQDLRARLAREQRRGVRPAINLSGVVLNTGLGRAPVHAEAAERMAQAAGGYSILEVDRDSGQRNQRDQRLGELLARLTGAEAGIAVNNNAAAVLLLMHAFSKGKEAIVSRGELVEIGGSFRVPEVLESAGARLVAVGATNRTRIADYERAIVNTTGLLLKVHTSNYRLVGFTEEVPAREMAELGRTRGIPTAWDLGSGRIEAPGAQALDRVGDETVVRDAVASGVDVVTFSGDKLLGGPQAGLIVGKREAVATLRRCPMYRALRLDKVALAGLEATCELLLAGRGDELPTRQMLLMEAEATGERCQAVQAALQTIPGVHVTIVPSSSQPGSGSAPTVELPGFALQLRVDGWKAQELAQALRRADPAVFSRVQENVVWLDPRTLMPGELEGLCQAVRSIAPGA